MMRPELELLKPFQNTKGATWYGVPIDDMDRDELKAALMMAIDWALRNQGEVDRLDEKAQNNWMRAQSYYNRLPFWQRWLI